MRHSPAHLIYEVIDLPIGAESHLIAAVSGVKAFLGAAAQSFDPGFVFLLALLQEPEAFAHPSMNQGSAKPGR